MKIGSPIRYTGTGTTGYVLDMFMENCEMWVKMDTTGLTYHASTLVLIRPDEVRVKGRYGKLDPTVNEIMAEMGRKLLRDVRGADEYNIIGH